MALQNQVGLAGGIQAAVHLLRQEDIVGAAPDDPACQGQIGAAASQHLRQVRDNAHAAAALCFGSQLGKEGRGAVQAVHKDRIPLFG